MLVNIEMHDFKGNKISSDIINTQSVDIFSIIHDTNLSEDVDCYYNPKLLIKFIDDLITFHVYIYDIRSNTILRHFINKDIHSFNEIFSFSRIDLLPYEEYQYSVYDKIKYRKNGLIYHGTIDKIVRSYGPAKWYLINPDSLSDCEIDPMGDIDNIFDIGIECIHQDDIIGLVQE